MTDALEQLKCPSCGAPLDTSDLTVCKYCGATIEPEQLVGPDGQSMTPDMVGFQKTDLENGFVLDPEKTMNFVNDHRPGFVTVYYLPQSAAPQTMFSHAHAQVNFTLTSRVYFLENPDLALAWHEICTVPAVDKPTVLDPPQIGTAPKLWHSTTASGDHLTLCWVRGRVRMEIVAGPSDAYGPPVNPTYVAQLAGLSQQLNARAARVSIHAAT